MRTMNLALAILALAATSAVAGDMKAGPRVEVAPNPPDARNQGGAKAAFDGDKTYLVVWQQGGDFYQTETSDLYAARVSADGKLLDEKPIVVCTAADCQLGASVAFAPSTGSGPAGGVFLVVWSDLRSGKDFDIYAARVTPEGKVLDKDGFLVAGGAQNQYGPSVAPGDGKFLVAWQDYRDEKGYALYAARVGADGKVLDAGGVSIGGPGKVVRGGAASLASAGNSWFLFWKTPEAGYTAALARIEEKGGAVAVAEINGRPPLASGCSGGAASDGKHVVYAGTSVGGRGQENRPGTVLMFDVSKCEPLFNSDPKTKGKEDVQSSWQADRKYNVHSGNPGIDGPVAIAHSGGIFLMAAKGASKGYPMKPSYSNQIHAARLDADGKLIEQPGAWQVLDDGAQPCSGPALAGGKDGQFLLVYSVDGGPGKQRLVARVVGVK